MRLPPVLIAAAAFLLQGQQPIRVSVTLVQLDAVVTDKDGRQVTDLTADDFEVFQDGKPKTITHFSYVRTPSAPPVAPGQPAANRSGGVVLRREQVHRTIAFLVDDLKMSMVGLHFTREALKKFINEQMAPGDLVAVIATSGGSGALQQFTTDKNMLLASVGKLRFLLGGGGKAGSVPAIGDPSVGANSPETLRILARRFAVGTMGALRHTTLGMREMPGRKSLVLFSEALSITQRKRSDDPPLQYADMRDAADRANRAAVVIYGVDPRGLEDFGLRAADNVQNMENEEILQSLTDRKARFRDAQEGLSILAAETGGTTYLNSNDIAGGLAQMMREQQGYYLLGFQPSEEDGARLKDPDRLAALKVRVKRPGLRVRYRKGFIGGDTPSDPPATSPAERLLAALHSPFAGNDVPLRITPAFHLGKNGQVAVQALVHVPGSGFTFGPIDATGKRAATLHFVAATEGEDGAGGGASTKQSYVLRIEPEKLERMRQGGVVYTLLHELKKAGAYNLRIAVLDEVSGRIGSANRFIEIPEVRKDAVAMSGITMGQGDWRPRLESQQAEDSDLSPAIRSFARGNTISYGVTIYNARFTPGAGQPAVELQPRLLREGQVVWEGKRIPVIFRKEFDPRRIPAGGVFTLGERTPPGEYILELDAVDRTGKTLGASQWLDFELR